MNFVQFFFFRFPDNKKILEFVLGNTFLFLFVQILFGFQCFVVGPAAEIKMLLQKICLSFGWIYPKFEGLH